MTMYVHCSEKTALLPPRPVSGTGRAAYLTEPMPGTLTSAALHHAIQSGAGAGVRGPGTLCRNVFYHGITGRGKSALSENVMQALMTAQTGGRDAQ
ncbi:hypothetical protein [Pantoea sp. At-9b]|uniref:hypothetical protein n=1 Tax=Pantoea sp. (strain At-9b) TaxID=592316 RepID=UPI0001B3F884|nr:hypothetical protein [Pantoea sp. At-9b]ADU73054.1 hypothetical protein Pat9b_4074 [Pantoea sp. At-9b]